MILFAFPIYANKQSDYPACQPDVKIEAFREDVRKRNLRILEGSQRGESHGSLAKQFHLTRSRIDAIVHEFEEEKRRADRSHRLPVAKGDWRREKGILVGCEPPHEPRPGCALQSEVGTKAYQVEARLEDFG
jgi:hypothetical protein